MMKRLIFILTLLLLLSACETLHSPIILNKISPELIKYIDYKKGSWWVYEDSVNHKKDSVVCTDYQIKLYGPYNDDQVYQQLFTTHIHYMDKDTFTLYGFDKYSYSENVSSFIESDYKSFDQIMAAPPYDTSRYKYYYTSRISFKPEPVAPEVIINGIRYKNVIKLFKSKYDKTPNIVTELTWAEGVGIISKKHSDSSYYALVRYHLVK